MCASLGGGSAHRIGQVALEPRDVLGALEQERGMTRVDHESVALRQRRQHPREINLAAAATLGVLLLEFFGLLEHFDSDFDIVTP